MHKWKIYCEVSGGVTGYRAAWLKKDGKEQVFFVKAEAIVEAQRLNEKLNSNPFRTAEFKYTVIGYE